LNNIDKVNQIFLWATTDETKKMHMISWKKVARPKCRGGLGIQEARGKNLTLVAKLCWRMEKSRNVGWAEVLRKKYMTGSSSKTGHTLEFGKL